MQRLQVPALLLTVLFLQAGCRNTVAPPSAPSRPGFTRANNTKRERTPDEIALLETSVKGDTVAVKSLLEHGVSPNARDDAGRTPLSEAAYYGHTEIVKLLLDHGADILAKKNDGETPVTMAAGHKEIAAMMKRQMDLLEASGKGDAKAVNDLFDKGASANARDADGRTPLTEATWNNHADIVKLLLEKGANSNARKDDGSTPLSIATGKGYKEIVGLLKKAGAK